MPPWYQAIEIAAFLRENGWPNATPDTISDMDPYWIQRAMDFREVNSSPSVEKARARAKKRADEKERKKTGGHLVDASLDKDERTPEEIQAEVERNLRNKHNK